MMSPLTGILFSPPFFLGTACGAACYLRARANGARQQYDVASDWHRWLHFWGNASNVVLYYGLSL